MEDLLARMTVEEKFWQLFAVPGDLADGADKYRHGVFGLQLTAARSAPPNAGRERDADARRAAERANATQHWLVEQTRLGIPAIFFEEAVHGLLQDGAMVYPSAIGLAATFDSALVGRVAQAIAAESRARGVRQVLSPVINVATDPRWGRVEETYGEDPWLSSVLAVAYVAPFERAGIVTTPKHFVANFGDGGRDSYPIDVSERQLAEIYFPPFVAALQRGGARSVMASYNSVDGLPATASPWLLTTVLRDQWKFRGVVMGDAAATGGAQVLHFTSPDNATSSKLAIESGLDVIFQTSVDQGASFFEPFRRGTISTAAIDRAVRRVLTLKFEMGLFEHPYVTAIDAAPSGALNARRALARNAAEASLVLLRNDRALLPLSRDIGRVAVIGADAVEARVGGYSPADARAVSIADALRERLGAARVRVEAGVPRVHTDVTVIPVEQLRHDCSADGNCRARGLAAEYFDAPSFSAAPRAARTDSTVDFSWTLNGPARGVARDWYAARWTGRIVAPVTGAIRIGVEGNQNFRLWVSDSLVIDSWRRPAYGRELRTIAMERGRSYDVRLEYAATRENGRIKLVWDHGVDATAWQAQIAASVAAARASDVAVVVAGVEEGEFRDRSSLALPGKQEELIRAVSASGTPVVVVLVGGSAVTMGNWLGGTRAVLEAWYPGEEGGRAVVSALFGDVNPAGRLPITFPVSEGQLPIVYNHKPTGRGDDYLDLKGEPAFPFGFGLSYTTFEYSELRIEPAVIPPGGRATVRFRVRNSGARAGDEVAQLYVRDVVASVAQPVIALKGAQRLHLAAGEAREVTFALGPESLSLLDASLTRVVEPGEFRVSIGASSRDLRLRGTLTIR